MRLAVTTPLIPSPPLTRLLGRPVRLKLDALQPTGSFKIRGMEALCRAHAQAGVTHLVSSSGGNAGRAAAHAGRHLGLAVTVVVPSTTPPWMRRRIEAEGAAVRVVGEVWDEAHAAALELAEEVGAAVVHPFDDPLLWSGHASLVEELAAQGPPPGALVVAVGGGGLLCGVLEGLERVGWSDVPVVAAETLGAASLAAALEVGAPVDIGAIRSIASSLGARTVATACLKRAQAWGVRSAVVSDAAAVRACRAFLDDHRLLVEPACGAALALAYEQHPVLERAEDVTVVVCGGSAVRLADLERWSQALGLSADGRAPGGSR